MARPPFGTGMTCTDTQILTAALGFPGLTQIQNRLRLRNLRPWHGARPGSGLEAAAARRRAGALPVVYVVGQRGPRAPLVCAASRYLLCPPARGLDLVHRAPNPISSPARAEDLAAESREAWVERCTLVFSRTAWAAPLLANGSAGEPWRRVARVKGTGPAACGTRVRVTPGGLSPCDALMPTIGDISGRRRAKALFQLPIPTENSTYFLNPGL